MKFKIVSMFGWPAEQIKELLSTGEDIAPPDKLPNVSVYKMIELKKDGKNFVRKNEWCVHGQIPKAAQKIIRPDMLTFDEISKWDHAKGAFFTKIVPHHLKNIFVCESTSSWLDAEGGKATRREYAGVVEVKIPLLGGLVEGTIVDHLKKNTIENTKLIKEELTNKLGAEYPVKQ